MIAFELIGVSFSGISHPVQVLCIHTRSGINGGGFEEGLTSQVVACTQMGRQAARHVVSDKASAATSGKSCTRSWQPKMVRCLKTGWPTPRQKRTDSLFNRLRLFLVPLRPCRQRGLRRLPERERRAWARRDQQFVEQVISKSGIPYGR